MSETTTNTKCPRCGYVTADLFNCPMCKMEPNERIPTPPLAAPEVTEAEFCRLYRKHFPTPDTITDAELLKVEAGLFTFVREVAALSASRPTTTEGR